MASRSRTAIVQIRTSDEVKALVEKMAEADATTVTAFVTALIVAEAKRRKLKPS